MKCQVAEEKSVGFFLPNNFSLGSFARNDYLCEKSIFRMTEIAHIHRFSASVGQIDLPRKFTFPFHYTPHPLALLAAAELQEYLSQKTEWRDELQQGKMFGVLVVKDADGRLGFLSAFSGNLQKSNSHAYFVPPIYDLLQPDGFFKSEELVISEINRKIEQIKICEDYTSLKNEFTFAQKEASEKIDAEKKLMKEAKAARDKRKATGATPEALAEMVKESQFQKAELKRLEKKLSEELMALKEKCATFETEIERLKKERKQRSLALQMRLFEQFQIRNAKGEVRGLCEIFAPTSQGVPPAGAGECAAPKLLQYAYLHHLTPLTMAEFWWGNSPKTEIRHHLHYYPACKHKCEPILNFMLQGLEVDENPLEQDVFRNVQLKVLYEDDYLIVINKPAGMLSVPGKLGLTSVVDALRNYFSGKVEPLIVHRLDMATSGLLLVAKEKDAHKNLQEQFKNHTIRKCYCAILDGEIGSDRGVIDLPLLPDFENRPRQIVSYEHGKKAVTRFEVVERKNGKTKILFYPETGRTHQLRLHSAHAEGLATPICGDELYGKKSDRLYLHAQRLEFTHPITNERIKLEILPDWEV